MIPERPVALILVVAALLGAAAPLEGQSAAAPEGGIIFWPVFVSGPLRSPNPGAGSQSASADDSRLLVELRSENSYIYDPGYSRADRLIIVDYEVTSGRISYGWSPDGYLGRRGGRLSVDLTSRVAWGGILDGPIDLHHRLTTLSNADREERGIGEAALILGPDVPAPRGTKLSEYPDDAFADRALLYGEGALSSFSSGLSYTVELPAPGLATFLGGTVTVLPPLTSRASTAERGSTAEATGGLFWQRSPWERVTVALEAGVAYLTLIGSTAWETLLERRIIWHGGGRVDLHLGTLTLNGTMAIRRSPVSIGQFRLNNPAVSLDVSLLVPVVGAGTQLLLGFSQDFVPHYVAPDFGLRLGVLTTIPN